jgi:hypothetical protein
MVSDRFVFKIQFQVSIAAGLMALSLFLFALVIPSGVLLALSAICAICVPLPFLAGILYVIFRKE